jgi:translation elongation factor EF-1beta
MANVAVVFKIYPKDGEFDKAIEGIKSLKPSGMQTEDIGFGIKVIKALFKFDDSSSSSSQLEEKLKALEGVSEVEVVEETLV